MSEITELRTKLTRLQGKQEQLSETIKRIRLLRKAQKQNLIWHEQAREVIRSAGLATQEQLQYHISDITSLALEAVFPDPYELIVDFVHRRNKTECDLVFQRNGERVDPITASGGGAIDVASFALRIASWAMMNPRTRNTIILDEPFKHLSTDLLARAGVMLDEISKKLKLQIIMVTHSEELAETGDTVFTVSMQKGISNVRAVSS